MVVIHGALSNVQGTVITRVLCLIKRDVSVSIFIVNLLSSSTASMGHLFSKLWVIWCIDWVVLKILEADVGYGVRSC